MGCVDMAEVRRKTRQPPSVDGIKCFPVLSSRVRLMPNANCGPEIIRRYPSDGSSFRPRLLTFFDVGCGRDFDRVQIIIVTRLSRRGRTKKPFFRKRHLRFPSPCVASVFVSKSQKSSAKFSVPLVNNKFVYPLSRPLPLPYP